MELTATEWKRLKEIEYRHATLIKKLKKIASFNDGFCYECTTALEVQDVIDEAEKQ